MIAYTYNSLSVWLLPYIPNWGADKVIGSFSMLDKVQAGLSNREERENLGATLRATMKYTALLNTAEAAEFRAAIAAWDNRPILTPFWPVAVLASSILGTSLTSSLGLSFVDSTGKTLKSFGPASSNTNPSVVSDLNIFYEPDWSHYEVTTLSAPITFTPSVNCLVAPVLWGRFTDKMPEATVITGNDYEEVQFDLTENGPASIALSPAAVTLTNGPVVNGFIMRQLTVPFHWEQNKSSGDVIIKRDTIGFSRDDTDTFYPQTPRSVNTLDFNAMTSLEIGYLLALFLDRGATVWPFWAQPPWSANVGNAVFGRFFSNKLTIEWDLPATFGKGECASANVEFVTLPTEYTVPSGEFFAASIGPKPSKWFGYKITDGTLTWYWTSYESDILNGPGGKTFSSSANITHGTIEQEINLQVNDCTLNVQDFPTSPFRRLRNALAAPLLTVTIYEGYTSTPNTATPIFTGYAQSPETKGPNWKIKLRGLGSKLDVQGPHLLLQTTCVAAFCDSRCKLTEASVQVTPITLNSITGSVCSFGSGRADPVGKFKNGRAKRPMPDGSVQNYMILDSSGTGALLITLSETLIPAPTGAEPGWTLVPGCDGQLATCVGYGNLVNMRAAPYVPAQDPFIPAAATIASGKKG